jgi:hypothetical protein
MSHAQTKVEKLLEARRLYFLAPEGIGDSLLAQRLSIDRATAYRYRKELGAIEVSNGKYTLIPTEEDIQLALAVLQRVHR